MATSKFGVGEYVPEFRRPTMTAPDFTFSSVAGRWAVLSFLGSAMSQNSEQAISFISGELRKYFDDQNILFFGVVTDPEETARHRLQQMIPGIRYFLDGDSAVSRLYGALSDGDFLDPNAAPYAAVTYVLDPMLRVYRVIRLDDVSAHNRSLAKILKDLPPVEMHAGVQVTAPVLILPRILDLDFCEQLIELYENHGGKESGSMKEVDGMTVGTIDHQFKRRKDYVIEDETFRARLRTAFNKRLVPELMRAFQFRVAYVERYIVAMYDSQIGGFFKPHRDNTTRSTAHRKFACTINLNADAYEGGDLRFPEFGSQTYRAPTGGAVVFSCSLLHEATPVTKGRRYATLPFFYDAEGRELRKTNMRFLANSNKHSSGV